MMKTMMVVLLATGAWFGVSGDRTVDKSTADHNAKTANIETPPSNVVAEWLGVIESSVRMVEIRNTGGHCVDVSDYHVAPGTKLELVHGSFDLAPDETALIVTHEDVPLDDEPRNAYTNLYRAVTSNGSVPTFDVDTFTLADGTGRVLGDGGTTSIDRLGMCCNFTQDACMEQVNIYFCCTLWFIGGECWEQDGTGCASPPPCNCTCTCGVNC